MPYIPHTGTSSTFLKDSDPKPWLEYQETGSRGVDKTSELAPVGTYIEPIIPDPILGPQPGRDDFYGSREGGTKEIRLRKNMVLTERSVSITRMLPEDRVKFEESMKLMNPDGTRNSPVHTREPIKAIRIGLPA